MRANRNSQSGRKRVLAFGVATSVVFGLYLLCFGIASGHGRILPPSFSWIGYTQRNGRFYGAVGISNANAVVLNIRGLALDGEAHREATLLGKPYLPPIHEPFFPPAAVSRRTNIVYFFPEPDSQSVTQVVFVWNAYFKETKLKSGAVWLWNTVKSALPKALLREGYRENYNEGSEVLNLPAPPNATNSGPVLRGKRERIMF